MQICTKCNNEITPEKMLKGRHVCKTCWSNYVKEHREHVKNQQPVKLEITSEILIKYFGTSDELEIKEKLAELPDKLIINIHKTMMRELYNPKLNNIKYRSSNSSYYEQHKEERKAYQNAYTAKNSKTINKGRKIKRDLLKNNPNYLIIKNKINERRRNKKKELKNLSKN